MLYSNVIALYLAAVSAFHSPQISEGFTILRPLHSRGVTTSPLSLWVDDQHGFSTSKTATECVDMQAKACLKSSCDVEHMSILLQKLEKIQNDCTEEGRQTDDECDVSRKAEREALIHAMEEKITNTVASTMVIFMSTSSMIEDQVKACVDGDVAFTIKQMKVLLHALESLNIQCTEEGRQTDDECDISRKDQRDDLARKLQHKTQIRNCLDTGKCTLGELTHMLASLEKQNDLCTEEGHQTEDECDVLIKTEREDLMELLAEQITVKQSESAKKTKMCMQYKLCDTSALRKTLEDLEELTSICTEEGNQTRSFCSIEVKAQRDELMEQLGHELELAENIGESVFQI